MGKGPSIKDIAKGRMTRALRTARALADMATHLLDWERSHRALLAAEIDRDVPTPPVRVRAGADARESAGGDGAQPATTTTAVARASAPATALEARGPIEEGRFRDTIARSHAPRAATLGSGEALADYAPSTHDARDREDEARATH